ncbi:unnamed protein product, partial [Scytosiphon promiscuus]
LATRPWRCRGSPSASGRGQGNSSSSSSSSSSTNNNTTATTTTSKTARTPGTSRRAAAAATVAAHSLRDSPSPGPSPNRRGSHGRERRGSSRGGSTSSVRGSSGESTTDPAEEARTPRAAIATPVATRQLRRPARAASLRESPRGTQGAGRDGAGMAATRVLMTEEAGVEVSREMTVGWSSRAPARGRCGRRGRRSWAATLSLRMRRRGPPPRRGGARIDAIGCTRGRLLSLFRGKPRARRR